MAASGKRACTRSNSGPNTGAPPITMVSRPAGRSRAESSSARSIESITAGTTNNVSPETAVIEGTIRAISERTRNKVRDGIRRVAEGVSAAAALKCLGGEMHGRLWPRNDDERTAAESAGYDIGRILTADDLVAAKGSRRISLCLPARDEATTVGAIVASVQQALVHDAPLVDELLVLDDHSTDATAQVAAAAGARVVAGQPLPAGWAGKAWALQQGIEAAAGPVVITLDADARPGSGLVPVLVDRLVAGAAFLTPYAYLFLAGHAEMPAYATVALATLVAVMATASILRVRQQCVGCDPLPAVELAFADEV